MLHVDQGGCLKITLEFRKDLETKDGIPKDKLLTDLHTDLHFLQDVLIIEKMIRDTS